MNEIENSYGIDSHGLSQRIQQADQPIKSPPNSGIFWWAFGILFLMLSWLLFSTRPGDVLLEVQELREEVRERTADRFYRSEFEAWLARNPELNQ